MKKPSKIGIVVIIACLAVAASCIAYLAFDRHSRNKAQETFEEMVPEVSEEEPPKESIIPPRDIDWDDFHAQNEDIYAYLSVPGTSIEYPVLQHPTDDMFYLENNMDGTPGRPGCIYSEHVYNSNDLSDAVTLLYGHNIKAGTMFNSLMEYRDEAFFNENKYIFVYTPNGNYAFEIFLAEELDDRHLLYGWDFSVEGAMKEYFDYVYEAGVVDVYYNEQELTDDDKLMVLSTCATSAGNDMRYIVVGKLVESPS